jgi:hypothetical protein
MVMGGRLRRRWNQGLAKEPMKTWAPAVGRAVAARERERARMRGEGEKTQLIGEASA